MPDQNNMLSVYGWRRGVPTGARKRLGAPRLGRRNSIRIID